MALDRSVGEPVPGDLAAVTRLGAYGAAEASTPDVRSLILEVVVRNSE